MSQSHLQACRRLGWATLPAKVLPKDTNPRELSRLAVTETVCQRPLHLVEQARCMGILADGCRDDQRALRSMLAELGLDGWWALRDKLLAVDAMTPRIKKALRADIIGLSVALELSTWDSAAADRVLGLFEALSLGLNRQRETLTLAREIALREKRSLVSILDGLRLDGADGAADRGAQARRLRHQLFTRRYPRRAQAQADFELKARRLSLGPGVRLIPPPNFESPVYRLEMGFRCRDELGKQVETLRRVVESPDLNDLLDAHRPPGRS